MGVPGVAVAVGLNHLKTEAIFSPMNENSKIPQFVAAYIGVGSNLADPMAQVRSAFEALSELSESNFISSSLYLSPPMGPSDQPDYVNAVVRLDTALSAFELLLRLQAIELNHGRVQGKRWGARTLDLDLLLYSDAMIESESLTVPHPGIAERDFVLVPLREIAPNLELPGLGPVAALCKACTMQGVIRHVN